MTTEKLIELIIEALEDQDIFSRSSIGRIDGEDCIGLDYDGQTWFIEVKEA